MKQFILKHKRAAGAIAACLFIAVVTLSFKETPFVNQVWNQPKTMQDTFPGKKHGDALTMKEFDRLIENMDKEMLKVGDEMKKIDVDAILKQADLSMKAVDIDKIMKEVELSMKEIDLEKIQAEVTGSMKEIDMDKINADVQAELKEAKQEMEKAKLEIKNIDRAEIKKEMENAKLEIEKSKDEIKKIDIDKIMHEAKEGIGKAKQELKELKTMFTEMENDGLINSKNGFKIEFKNSDLYINGEKQKQPVTDKYRKYFKEDHFEMEIEKE